VHPATIRRWIDNGRLRAYRVGDKAIRLARSDVTALTAPVPTPREAGEHVEGLEAVNTGRLTEGEKQRGLAIVAAMRRALEQQSAHNGGEPLVTSLELIHEMREERTRELMSPHEF
jgi:excisionase family DNA binding protein